MDRYQLAATLTGSDREQGQPTSAQGDSERYAIWFLRGISRA